MTVAHLPSLSRPSPVSLPHLSLALASSLPPSHRSVWKDLSPYRLLVSALMSRPQTRAHKGTDELTFSGSFPLFTITAREPSPRFVLPLSVHSTSTRARHRPLWTDPDASLLELGCLGRRRRLLRQARARARLPKQCGRSGGREDISTDPPPLVLPRFRSRTTGRPAWSLFIRPGTV